MMRTPPSRGISTWMQFTLIVTVLFIVFFVVLAFLTSRNGYLP